MLSSNTLKSFPLLLIFGLALYGGVQEAFTIF